MKRLTAHLLLLLWTMLLTAQPLCRIEHFDVSKGMQQDFVSCIAQGKDGMMWFSTYNGLSSYDGYNFKTYKYTPGQKYTLSNNRIITIAETKYGDIWCLTYDAKAYLFNPRTQTFFNVSQTFEQSEKQCNKEVKNIYTLPKGVSWLTCNDGTIYRVDEAHYQEEKGVVRYDIPENSQSERQIFSVFQDMEGDEWILTDKGTFVFDKSSKQPEDNLPYKYGIELNGSIYLAADDGTVLCYDLRNKEFTAISLPSTIKKINRLVAVRKNLLAFASDCGVALYNPARGTSRILSIQTPEQACNNATYIYEDRLGELWVYTDQPGIVRLNIDTEEKQYLTTGRQQAESFFNLVFVIFEDPNGTLWVRPNYGNFAYYDRQAKQLKFVKDPDNPEKPFNPIIRFSFQDKQGICWLSNDRGLKKISTYPSGYAMMPLDEHHEQRCFFKDNHQRLWVTSKKEYVRIYASDGTLQGYLSPQGNVVGHEVPFGGSVYAICRDHEGDIWLATRWDGLFRLTEQDKNSYRVRHYTHDPNQPNSLSSNSLFAVFCDSRGQVWAGSYGGGLNLIQKESAGEVNFIHAGNRLLSYPIDDFHNIRCITETSSGVILLGTTAGLISFSPDFQSFEDIHFYTNRQEMGDASRLTGNDVIAVYEASDRTVYVLTVSGGVNKVLSGNLLSNDLRFKYYSQASGLGSDMVCSIIEDAEQKLWVVSEYGLSRFDPKQESFENYNMSDLGFKQNFSDAQPFLCDNGRILFGTNKGILEVTPSLIKKSAYVPSIVFTELKVGNRRVDVPTTGRVELQPDERSLSVEFAALDYNRTENIHYAYRLVGLDKKWNRSGKNRQASYLNLPPGDYTLQVRSTNGNGVKCDNITTLAIRVVPTFWETSWAWFVYLLFFLLAVGVITLILLYIYRLRHRVSMEKHLADVKLRFFTDISHELRTPLTLISAPVTELLEDETLAPEVRQHLTTVNTNTQQMLNLVNQILDFRKIQHNKMKLLVERTELLPLMEQMLDKFRFIAEERNITLNFLSEVPLTGWIDRAKVETMLSNLLTNAFKYTHPGRAIRVSLRQMGEEGVVISVADEGVGIAPDKLDSIFYRFEALTGNSTSQPSSGIGLSLVKRLVELHHGTIQVSSKVGVGSEFVITLPIDRVTYEQDSNAELVFADGATDDTVADTEPEEELTGEVDERDTILVVEDNTELRTLLKNILHKHYRVLEACNGEEGLQLATRAIPDMIISDIMMPVMDGLEMVRRIKEDKDICHALIVLLTAKAALDDRITAVEQGVDDYITKPFSATYLKTRVSSLFNRRRQLQEQLMQQLSAPAIVPVGTAVSAADWKPTQPDALPHDELFMKELMAYIEEQMDNSKLTMDEVADHLNMGRGVFYRKLKSIVGMTPVLFVQKIRLQRACQLLATKDYTVSQVAYMAGFGDPKYFNRCFKKQMGVTPTEYMKQVD